MQSQAQQLPWRLLTIILAIALGLTVLITSAVTAYYNGRVRVGTKTVIFPSNDTGLVDEVNIRDANVEQLCFSQHPYCMHYEPEPDCIATYGSVCFENVNIGGKLAFVGDGSFDNNQTSFMSIKIGDLWCHWNGTAVICSGAPLHLDVYALPMAFDPDRFASFYRQGSTFVVNSTTLRILGHIVGDLHADQPVYLHDRLYLGNGIKTIIYRGPNGTIIFGNPQSEFLDNVIIQRNFTVHGRLVGSNLKLDADRNIDLYGTHSYITQHEGDLDVCATNGIVRLCGTKLSLAFNEIEIGGDIINTPHFLAGMQVEGTSLFYDIEAGGEVRAATLKTTGSIDIGGGVTSVGPISTSSTITGNTLTIIGEAFSYSLATSGPLTSGGTFTANAASNLLGITSVAGNFSGNGPRSRINSPLFEVKSDNVSMTTTGPISLNTTNVIYLQVTTEVANRGVCVGAFNTSSYNLTHFCGLHYEPFNKTVYVNKLAVITQMEFYNSAGNIQSTIGSAQYGAGFSPGPGPNDRLFVIDSDLFVNGYAYMKDGYNTVPTATFTWDPPHCDQRLKENIRPSIEEESAILLGKVNIYNFRYKKDIPASRDRPGERRGPIAQELIDILPRAVYEEGDGFLSVDYNELIPDLVNANKLLMRELQEMKKQLAALKSNMDALPFHVKEFDSKEDRERFFEKQPRRKPVVNS